jgi:hypothetical protein
VKNKRRKQNLGWSIFFLAVTIFTVLPFIARYGKFEPFIAGMSYTFFWWFAATLVLIAGIIVFEVTTFSKWREEDNE